MAKSKKRLEAGSVTRKRQAGVPPRRGARAVVPAVKSNSKNNIEFIARGVLIRGTEVLLCQNLKHGYFYLPGGHVEFAESARVAVEREFLEETGLRVRALELALVSEGVFATKKRSHHELNLVFHVEPTAGVPREGIRSREDAIGFSWIDLAVVPELDVRPLTAKAFLAAGAGGASRQIETEWVSEFPES